MTWPGRRMVDPEPLATGLYAVRRSTPQVIIGGDHLRGMPCLVCGFPLGSEAIVTASLTHYLPDAMPAGDVPSTAWLLHASHRGVTTRAIHDLAQWRQATGTT